MRERCPRDGKELDSGGGCRHCGTTYPAMVGTPMTRGEVRKLVRRVRLMSGSCKGRRHDECKVSTCECFCHDPKARQGYAEHLRREAAELEQTTRSTDADVRQRVAERAEELRSRADDWYQDGAS